MLELLTNICQLSKDKIVNNNENIIYVSAKEDELEPFQLKIQEQCETYCININVTTQEAIYKSYQLLHPVVFVILQKE